MPTGRFLAELGGMRAVSRRAGGSTRRDDAGLHNLGGAVAGFGLNAEGQGCISRTASCATVRRAEQVARDTNAAYGSRSAYGSDRLIGAD
jgi:hypothetical protein